MPSGRQKVRWQVGDGRFELSETADEVLDVVGERERLGRGLRCPVLPVARRRFAPPDAALAGYFAVALSAQASISRRITSTWQRREGRTLILRRLHSLQLRAVLLRFLFLESFSPVTLS